jgi:hypothetical protein
MSSAGFAGTLFGGIGESVSDMITGLTDPTLGTSLPAEANIRNLLSFANIKISFPTTDKTFSAANNFISVPGLTFPAYITNFTDRYNIQFNSQDVYGRNDPIPTYQSTKRGITVTLKIPCFDRDDANENMKKINAFIRNLYPSYKEVQGDFILSAPPLIRVKFANLVVNHVNPAQGLLGYLTSFSYNFTPSDGFFMSNGIAFAASALFFRSYTISFTMNVLHDTLIGYKDGKFMGPTNDYPYRTNLSAGDIIQSGLNQIPALSSDVSSAQILGLGD